MGRQGANNVIKSLEALLNQTRRCIIAAVGVRPLRVRARCPRCGSNVVVPGSCQRPSGVAQTMTLSR